MAEQQRLTDCLVVGGGLVGMLTAHFLAGEGLTVRLLERGEICRESSWAGGGILSPLVPWQYPEPVSALAGWSQRFYPRLADELLAATGIDIEWTRSGLLMLDVAPEPPILDWAARNRCPLEPLEAARLPDLEPALGTAPERSLLLPAVAQLRNPRLGAAMRRLLEAQGVLISEHMEVSGFSIADGRIRGACTSRGEVAAGRIIIAGGAWSAPLLARLQIDLPVKPVKGQMIQYQAPVGLLGHIVLHRDHYLIPRRDGLLLAGSTLENSGYDKTTTTAARELLMQKASGLVPALQDCPVVRHWAGLRPGTTDGIPLIGPHPALEGLLVNTGHFRNGVVLAPASARLLADLLLGRDPIVDAEPYRPEKR